MANTPRSGPTASELVLQVHSPNGGAGLRLARGTSALSLGPSLIPDESLPAAMQRMTVELLNGAVNDLAPNRPTTFHKGIHSSRKKLKRVRGLIRLVRDTVGYRTYRDQNVVLRDTARMLSGVRDAWVLVKTLNKLREDYAHLLDPDTFSETEAWLLLRHGERQATVRGQTVIDAVTNLGTARSVFDAYPAEERIADEFGAIAGGLRRVYRRGHRGYRRAEETRSVIDLHEWRKRVKYLTFQLEALAPLQPALIGSMASELDELGRDLGDDHDLAILAETVIDYPDACVDTRERWLLLAVIYQARTDLKERSLRRGAALYAEQPHEFVDRVDAYWQAGRR